MIDKPHHSFKVIVTCHHPNEEKKCKWYYDLIAKINKMLLDEGYTIKQEVIEKIDHEKNI